MQVVPLMSSRDSEFLQTMSTDIRFLPPPLPSLYTGIPDPAASAWMSDSDGSGMATHGFAARDISENVQNTIIFILLDLGWPQTDLLHSIFLKMYR